MTIRPATPADLTAIHDLHLSNWRAAYRALLPDTTLEGAAAEYLAARWGPDALERDTVLVAAGPQQSVLGFVALRIEAEGHLYVDNLHVAPASRGRGLSRALMAQAARIAGARPVRLTVLDGNEAARAIYARWGGAEGPSVEERFLGITLRERRVDWPTGAALLRGLGTIPE